jgi:hypothetical protein
MACPYPRIVLRIRDRYGLLVPLDFRIDSGSDCAALPLSVAQREGIGYGEERRGTVAGLVGATEKFRDVIRVVIAGREHVWPCDFVRVPPPAPGRLPDPLLQAGVLGRAGFLDDYALAIDSGYLILTRLGPVRRWLRRCLHAVWQALGLVRRVEEPV